MLNSILRTYFNLAGWKITHKLSPDLKKALFVVGPHNLTADFIIGLCCRAVLNLNINFLGKEELFRPPFGWIFKKLGGTPVYRRKSTNFVQQVAETFNNHEKLLVAMAPEGTRKNISKLRTGFYYMAHAAKIPLIMVGFDFPRKLVIIAEPFMTSGDFETDMQTHYIPFFESIGGLKKDWMKNYKDGKFNE
jgi:1-acyl-sn-glycerol-3-phosphate acyltransferase